jgi:hypothetical protein
VKCSVGITEETARDVNVMSQRRRLRSVMNNDVTSLIKKNGKNYTAKKRP